ncbi:MAG: hypothetical protein IPN69_18600 [Acidobacteria bacterium]|nr:hypothetical protein [Acidobacteriota bacterium]
MRISDISIEDVRRGLNWKFVHPDDSWLGQPMEHWDGVLPLDAIHPEDSILYSGLVVLSDGVVLPTVTLKEVGSPEYGGDYCWHVNGSWRQVGLEKVDVEIVKDFIAGPLDDDPSFDSDDGLYREEHKQGFQSFCIRISGDVKVVVRPW